MLEPNQVETSDHWLLFVFSGPDFSARREERSDDTFVVLWLHSQFVFYTSRVKLYLLTNTSVTLAFKEVFVVAFNKTVVLNFETLLIVLLIQILNTIVPLTILRIK